MYSLIKELLTILKNFYGKGTILLNGWFKTLWFCACVGAAALVWFVKAVLDLFNKVHEFTQSINQQEFDSYLQYPNTLIAALSWMNLWFPVGTMLNYTYILFVATMLSYMIRALKAWIPSVA